MSLTAGQCRAARSLLGMEQLDLADSAKVAIKTLSDFETGKTTPRDTTLDAIRAALEKAGIEFIPENGGGAGVRLKKRSGRVATKA